MKRHWLVGLLAFSVGLNIVILGGTAFRSWGIPLFAAQRHFSESRPPFTWMLEFDEKRLQLTPPQSQAFKALRERCEKEEWQDRSVALSRISQLGEQLIHDNVTTQTLSPLMREVRRHSDDFFWRLARVLKEYRAVLNPDQNRIFTQMLQERFKQVQHQVGMKHEQYQRWMNQRYGVKPSPPPAPGVEKK